MTELPESLAALKSSGDIELKIYNVKPGHWTEFLAVWRKIIVLRRRAGFKVLFALIDEENNSFVWAVAHDSDWQSNNVDYLSGKERYDLNKISDHISSFEMPHVLAVPVS